MIVRHLNNNNFKVLKDEGLYGLYTMFQELQLWLGECPMNVDAGVDYFSIFTNRTFIETELKKVLDKYKSFYNSYEILNIRYKDDVLEVDIIFNIDYETSLKFNLNISKVA